MHGGELFVNRRRKSITVPRFDVRWKNYTRSRPQGTVPITGPKKIGCYGASYLYPVLLALGILKTIPEAGRIYRCRNCERNMKSVQNAPHTVKNNC